MRTSIALCVQTGGGKAGFPLTRMEPSLSSTKHAPFFHCTIARLAAAHTFLMAEISRHALTDLSRFDFCSSNRWLLKVLNTRRQCAPKKVLESEELNESGMYHWRSGYILRKCEQCEQLHASIRSFHVVFTFRPFEVCDRISIFPVLFLTKERASGR